MERNEPYVKLLCEDDFRSLSKEDFIVINQNNRQSNKHSFYRLAFDFIKDSGIVGDYLEFGVHKARTFRMALSEARLQELNQMNFWAFDSFEGLPKSDSHNHVKWGPGALATSEQEFMAIIHSFGIFTERVKCVRGFYDETLTEMFSINFLNTNNKASMVTVDCDLYESAVPVFKFIEYIIQPGTVVYIDDYFVGHKGDINRGVSKAFNEFKEYSRYEFTEFLSVGWWGKSFIARG